MARLTKRKVEEAIRASRGVMSAAARALGVNRVSLYRAVRRYGLEEVVREAREELLDLVEDRLIQAALEGKPWAVMFVLKTLGRERGYTTRQEVALAPEGGVALRIVDEDPALPAPQPRD